MREFFSNLPWLQWVLVAVGIMSGFLSLIREWLTLTHPEKVNEKRLFWRCRLYAFIFSVLALWVSERATNIRLTKQQEAALQPDFRVVIAQITDTFSSNGTTVLLVQMGIFNKGADSVLANISAHYRSATLDKDVDVVYMPPEEEARAFPEEWRMEDRAVPNMRSVGTIGRGTLIPGKLFVVVPGNRQTELRDNPSALTISVHDYLGAAAMGRLEQIGNAADMRSALPFHQACGTCKR
jgi:hypothetical protein